MNCKTAIFAYCSITTKANAFSWFVRKIAKKIKLGLIFKKNK